MADKTTNWILKLTDQVSGPMSRIDQMNTSALKKIEAMSSGFTKISNAGGAAMGSLAKANGVSQATGKLEALYQRMERLHGLMMKAPSDKWITKFNDGIKTTEKEIQRLTSLTAKSPLHDPAPVQKVTGKIEVLNAKLASLRTSQQKAFSADEIRKFNREIGETEKELNKLNGLGKGFSIGGIGMGKAGIIGGITAGLLAAKNEIPKIFDETGDFEMKSTGFEVMLGNKSRSDKLLGDLMAFSNKSPLRFNSVTDATQTLLGYGVAVDNILPYVKMLGDVSMGDEQKFKGLSLAFAQVQANTRLMGQDLLQMINQGFNPLKEISEMTGMSMKRLRKEMEAGNISAEMVTKAFEHATGAGGRFAGMTDRTSQTLKGRWSTLMDSADMLRRSVGERLYGAFSAFISIQSAAINKVNDFIKIPVTQKMEEERIKVLGLVNQLFDHNLKADKRNRLYEEVLRLQPKVLEGINKESINYEALRKNVRKYNDEISNTIFLEKQREILKPFADKLIETTVKKAEVEGNMFQLMSQAAGLSKKGGYINAVIQNETFPIDQKARLVQKAIFNEPGKNSGELTSIYNKISDAMTQNSYMFNSSIPALTKDIAAAQTDYDKQLQVVNDAMGRITKNYLTPSDSTNTDTGAGDNPTVITPDFTSGTGKGKNKNFIQDTNDVTSGSSRGKGSGGGKSVVVNVSVNQTNKFDEESFDKRKEALKEEMVALIVDAASDAAIAVGE